MKKYNVIIQSTPYYAKSGEPNVEVNKTLKPTDRENSNTEIEKGEVVVTNLSFDGLPELYKAGGKSHAQGGTPVRLTDASFVFSKDKNMKLKDEDLLKDFKKTYKPSGYTFADIADQYDINKYRQTLADPNSDDLQRKTAETMISNYMKKLGKLAMLQESKKGFPQGIPHISVPFVTDSNFDVSQIYGTQGEGVSTDTGSNYQQMGGESEIKGFDRVNLMKYGKYITDKTKRDEQIKNITWNMLDDKWDPKDIYNNLGQMGGYGSNRGGNALYASEWGWDHKDVNKADIDKYINEYYEKSVVKKQEGGQTPTKKIQVKGIPAYDPEEQLSLEKLSPGIQLPSEFVESKQPSKSGVYGRFDQKAADENWKWYGKSIDWNNPKDVGEAQQAYNTRIYNKMIDAGYSAKTANLMMKRVGFTTDPNKPNSLDAQAGKYTETRKDFNIPKNTKPSYEESSKVVENLPDIKTGSVNVKPSVEKAPFWLQDQIQAAGAFMDMNRLKKYMPWQAPVNLTTPTATYYDPTRELAANAEQANIAATALGMYAGPQTLSARLSGIQGEALSNAGNILGKYNNMNVAVANQFAEKTADIQNQQALLKADMANNLYKDTMIVNQQFDNAKMAARQRFRDILTGALTNRAQTQALNQMYEQYQVDPSTGGFVKFNTPRSFDPSNLEGQGQSGGLAAQINQLISQIPGLTPDTAYKILTGK